VDDLPRANGRPIGLVSLPLAQLDRCDVRAPGGSGARVASAITIGSDQGGAASVEPASDRLETSAASIASSSRSIQRAPGDTIKAIARRISSGSRIAGNARLPPGNFAGSLASFDCHVGGAGPNGEVNERCGRPVINRAGKNAVTWTAIGDPRIEKGRWRAQLRGVDLRRRIGRFRELRPSCRTSALGAVGRLHGHPTPPCRDGEAKRSPWSLERQGRHPICCLVI